MAKERLIKYYLGIDIGGTKIATLVATKNMNIISREEFLTKKISSVKETIEKIFENLDMQMQQNSIELSSIISIGISCGGPLDSKNGLIMSPPNLPKWDNIEIVKRLELRYKKKTFLQNDANACALAEWKKGAGIGYESIVFLTFGTGMGAGLILDGKLYTGADDMAGEVGHIRLENDGPTGYGKMGSFEAFCSGGGIKRLGEMVVEKEIGLGYRGRLKEPFEKKKLTAKIIVTEARCGDKVAIEIIEISAKKLGEGLSVLIDILNPELIIIGSIYSRSKDLFEVQMNKALEKETLSISLKRCKILKSKLGEEIGDYGAIITATGDY